MKRGNPLCKKGLHRMTAANTYHHPAKGEECRECKREYMRLYMREKRAKESRQARRPAATRRAPAAKRPAAARRTTASRTRRTARR